MRISKLQNVKSNWTVCSNCQGRGKKSGRLRKKVRLSFQRALAEFEKNKQEGEPPVKPKAHLAICADCKGSGLQKSDVALMPDTENYPHVAIIGGGIGGVALAVALLHRQIPFTLYERDESFDARAQGYGLTLQQASKAIEALGVFELEKGVISTKHVVHSTDGKILGEWGVRKWLEVHDKSTDKRTNIHIARQSLRAALLEQLKGHKNVKWGHQLIEFKQNDAELLAKQNDQSRVDLTFVVNGELKTTQADLLVGADGIRSVVRQSLIGEQNTPLRYLGCMVILGICPLSNLNGLQHDLLDNATVFQTANGNERMYMMPYESDSIMWQFSVPMEELDAKNLSEQGPQALKEKVIELANWHDPIPAILNATQVSLVSGYPVYDRELLEPTLLQNSAKVTLLGDAAHPMSPFKGQGANQALLDALLLARSIKQGCNAHSNWKDKGIREAVLKDFETQMIQRSAPKVTGSAQAAKFLHSEVALQKADAPRGRDLS